MSRVLAYAMTAGIWATLAYLVASSEWWARRRCRRTESVRIAPRPTTAPRFTRDDPSPRPRHRVG